MSRRVRQLELGVIALSIAVILMAGLYLYYVAYVYESAKKPTVITSRPAYAGRDISHCFDESETRELWDCIIDEEA